MVILFCCSQPEIFTIISKMRFNVPTIIQMKSLPALLGDPPLNVLVRPDILVQSRSETGKTTALILTILSRVDVSKNWPQVTVVVIHTFISTGSGITHTPS